MKIRIVHEIDLRGADTADDEVGAFLDVLARDAHIQVQEPSDDAWEQVSTRDLGVIVETSWEQVTDPRSWLVEPFPAAVREALAEIDRIRATATALTFAARRLEGIEAVADEALRLAGLATGFALAADERERDLFRAVSEAAQ